MTPMDESGLVPVRMTIDVCCAVTRANYDNSDFWDTIVEAIESVPGFFTDGGSGGLMDADDVIPDGPLGQYLKAKGAGA